MTETAITILKIACFVIEAVALFGIVLYTTSPKRQQRKSGSKKFISLYLDMIIIIFVGTFIAGLFLFATLQSQYIGSVSPVITTENTPIRLFLAMTPDTTVEEVKDLAEEYDLQVLEVEEFLATGEHYLDLTIYVDGGLLSTYGGSDGVKLQLVYTSEDVPTLLYAYLFIKTDDGTASCYYYPTDYTQWGYKTGFNLTVKGAGQLFQHKYLLDTAQEAVDIAYAVVYPDGLG